MSLRGNHLFSQIIQDETTVAVKSRKGRNNEFHARRNEALADRYYYYGVLVGYNYQRVHELLEEEFFISRFYIPEIIGEQTSYLLSLRRDKVPAEALAKKWSRFSWRTK